MRTNLIIHLHCSECGARLKLCYQKEASTKPKEPGYGEADSEPTGAACFYPDAISVQPCRSCIEKYTAPAKKMVEAMEAMRGLGHNKTITGER